MRHTSEDSPTTDTHPHLPASFYEPNGLIGACGHAIQPSDFSVAVPIDQFANGAVCGRNIEITCECCACATPALSSDEPLPAAMNKSVIVTAQDECVTCSSTGSLVLDLTPAVFEVFANLNAGLIPITWNFV